MNCTRMQFGSDRRKFKFRLAEISLRKKVPKDPVLHIRSKVAAGVVRHERKCPRPIIWTIADETFNRIPVALATLPFGRAYEFQICAKNWAATDRCDFMSALFVPMNCASARK